MNYISQNLKFDKQIAKIHHTHPKGVILPPVVNMINQLDESEQHDLVPQRQAELGQKKDAAVNQRAVESSLVGGCTLSLSESDKDALIFKSTEYLVESTDGSRPQENLKIESQERRLYVRSDGPRSDLLIAENPSFKVLDQATEEEHIEGNRGTERGSACTPLLAQESAQSWKNNFSSGHFRESDGQLQSPPPDQDDDHKMSLKHFADKYQKTLCPTNNISTIEEEQEYSTLRNKQMFQSSQHNYESKHFDAQTGTDEDAYKFLGEIKMTASNPSQSMRSSCKSYDGGVTGAEIKLNRSSTPPSPGKGASERVTINSFLNNTGALPASSGTQPFDSSNNVSAIISNGQAGLRYPFENSNLIDDFIKSQQEQFSDFQPNNTTGANFSQVRSRSSQRNAEVLRDSYQQQLVTKFPGTEEGSSTTDANQEASCGRSCQNTNKLGQVHQKQNSSGVMHHHKPAFNSMHRNPSFNPNECDVSELVGSGCDGDNSSGNQLTQNANTEPEISPSVLKFELPNSSSPNEQLKSNMAQLQNANLQLQDRLKSRAENTVGNNNSLGGGGNNNSSLGEDSYQMQQVIPKNIHQTSSNRRKDSTSMNAFEKYNQMQKEVQIVQKYQNQMEEMNKQLQYLFQVHQKSPRFQQKKQELQFNVNQSRQQESKQSNQEQQQTQMFSVGPITPGQLANTSPDDLKQHSANINLSSILLLNQNSSQGEMFSLQAPNSSSHSDLQYPYSQRGNLNTINKNMAIPNCPDSQQQNKAMNDSSASNKAGLSLETYYQQQHQQLAQSPPLTQSSYQPYQTFKPNIVLTSSHATGSSPGMEQTQQQQQQQMYGHLHPQPSLQTQQTATFLDQQQLSTIQLNQSSQLQTIQQPILQPQIQQPYIPPSPTASLQNQSIQSSTLQAPQLAVQFQQPVPIPPAPSVNQPLAFDKDQLIYQLNQQLCDLNQQLQELQGELIGQSGQVELQQEKMNEQAAEIEQLQQKLANMQIENKEIQEKCKILQNENGRLQEQLKGKDYQIRMKEDELRHMLKIRRERSQPASPARPNRLENQLMEGSFVLELPIISSWSHNAAAITDKENLAPLMSKMPLRMLEKGEYLENQAEKMKLDDLLNHSKELWRNGSFESIKAKRPTSQGGLTGRSSNKRNNRISLKQQLISNLNLNTMMQQQINSVQVTDAIIKELREEKKSKCAKAVDQEKKLKDLEQQLERLQTEKTKLMEEFQKVVGDNNSIKQKFTTILSKFQGYIEEQERQHILTEEKYMAEQIEQQSIIKELNQAVQEMDRVTHDQKRLIQEKDDAIKSLINDKKDVLAERDYLKDKADVLQRQLNDLKFDRVQVESLNQQLAYIKGYHVEELEMFKKENKMLRSKITGRNQERSNDSRHLAYILQQQKHSVQENRQSFHGEQTQSQVSQRSASANLIHRKQGTLIDELPVRENQEQELCNKLHGNRNQPDPACCPKCDKLCEQTVTGLTQTSHHKRQTIDPTAEPKDENNSASYRLPYHRQRAQARNCHSTSSNEGMHVKRGSKHHARNNSRSRVNVGTHRDTINHSQERQSMLIQQNHTDRYVPLRRRSNSNERHGRCEDMLDYVANGKHTKLQANELSTGIVNTPMYTQPATQRGDPVGAGYPEAEMQAAHEQQNQRTASQQHSQSAILKSRNSTQYLEQQARLAPMDTTKGSQSIVKEFIETYQNQFDQMESDIVHKDTMIEGYRAEINSLKTYKSQHEQLITHIQNLQQENNTIKSDHEEVLKERERLKDEVEEMSMKVKELEDQIISQVKVEQTNQRNASLTEQRKKLLEQLETLNKSERNLQNKLEKAQKKLEEAEKEVKAEKRLFLQKIVQIAEVFEKKQIDCDKYSVDILFDFVFDKAKKHSMKLQKYQNELKQLQQERTLLLSTSNNRKYKDEIDSLRKSNQQLRHDLKKHIESKSSETTSRSLYELQQLKMEKPHLISKLDSIQRVLQEFQSENNMLKTQIKHIITTNNSSANVSHATLKPLINKPITPASQTPCDNASSISNNVSLINLYPPRQVLQATSEPQISSNTKKEANDSLIYQQMDPASREKRDSNITSDNTKSPGVGHPSSLKHNFGCIQNLFGESFDGRSQQTHARDVSAGISYQTSKRNLYKQN